ncbi:MAG: outer membrane protein assembly factor BamD [Alphaproteobacteria bacterium]
MKKQFGLLCVLLLLSACASHDKDMENASAEELYNTAFEDLEATRYKKAAEGFEKVETEHPYSQWAVKSKLMEAYAYYKDEKYDDAIMVLDRFIKYHPGNEHIDYAYYMKGICYYDQIAAADKDQGNTANAEEVFERLIALYPDSKYAEDARGKIKLTTDYQAGQEMIVGRYYLNDNNYLSALNRFNVVLEEYQTTIQIEEALYREVEIYAILGLNKYANGYYKILRDNYPNGKWTAKAAEVMEKIGVKDVKKSNDVSDLIRDTKAEEKTPEVKEEKSWFSRLFGSDNAEEKAEATKSDTEVKAEEVKEEVIEEVVDNDDKVTAEVEEVKVEVAEKADEVKAKPEEVKEEKGWFSRLFGLDDAEEKVEAAKSDTEVKVEEVQEEVTEEVVDNEDKVTAEVEEVKVEVAEKADEVKAKPEEVKEEKGWFSRLFNSDDTAKTKEDKKNETFMSAFGFDQSEETNEIAEETSKSVQDAETVEENIEKNAEEADDAAEKVAQTTKSEVGDIISSTKKGKK